MVDKVNAIVLAGGSAFGLDAATGVVRWLDEHNIGWRRAHREGADRAGRDPLRPAASATTRRSARPPTAATRPPRPRRPARCAKAASAPAPARRSASSAARAPLRADEVGHRQRLASRMPNGLVVAAIVAVNAVGDIIDPDTGKVVAGVRNPDGTFADARKILRSGALCAARRGPARTRRSASSPPTRS